MKLKTHAIFLLLICVVVIAPLSVMKASSSISAKESPGSLPVLVSLERVSNDLHLTSLQKSVVTGLRSDYRAAVVKIMQKKYETLSELAQAEVALDNLKASYNHRVIAILNIAQRHRLREIERQFLGGTLLTSPSEQKFLGLNEQQKNKISTIQKDAEKKSAAINFRADQGKLNYHQQVMALHKNRQEHASKMLKILTPTQMKVWNASQGARLTF